MAKFIINVEFNPENSIFRIELTDADNTSPSELIKTETFVPAKGFGLEILAPACGAGMLAATNIRKQLTSFGVCGDLVTYWPSNDPKIIAQALTEYLRENNFDLE